MTIFPSTLIIGTDNQAAESKIEEICRQLGHASLAGNPDLIFIGSLSGWGIDQVRNLKNFFSQKPFNHENKIVVISDAHNLNTEAQNALLKTLEEPGDNHYLLLATSRPASLLPTIISRCQQIKLSSPINSNSKIVRPADNLQQNLKLSEEYSQIKENILPFLEEQLILNQKLLAGEPDLKTAALIEKLIKCIQMIRANVDPKSALDYYFLA